MNEAIIRHQISRSIREYLFQRGYIEVVSPILRNCDCSINPRFELRNGKFLRDCMELPLRKKVSRVCPKIFEIGPCFRKDQESDTHHVEFYMMELYSLEEKLQHMIELMGNIVTLCMPNVSDIKEVSVQEFMIADLGIDIAMSSTCELVEAIAIKHPQTPIVRELPYVTVNRYIEQFLEASLTSKGCLYFLKNYPLCTISVASRKDGTNCIQRFECFINGMEVSNAFEDCMDEEDLADRMDASQFNNEEAKEMLALVKAKSISPTVGLGIGIDRLCMLMEKTKGGVKP